MSLGELGKPQHVARRFIPILWLTLGLIVAAILSRGYSFVLDDAFISLRYARNLVEGHGLVFNPGETPVEGYTNFLWVLIAAAHVPFTRWPEHWLLLYDKLAGFGVIAVVWWEMLRRGGNARTWLWLAVLLVALHETLHAWIGGGLETHFFSLLVIAAVGRFLREERKGEEEIKWKWWSAILVGLALLTRPEGYLVAAICSAALVTRCVATQFSAAAVRRASIWVTTCAAFAVPHLTFRRLYYGEWVPNTFFAKMPGPYFESGLPYLAIFLKANYFHWGLIATIVAIAFAGPYARPRPHFAFDRAVLAALIVGWFSYVGYAGGDHLEFRLLAPTVPLLALLIGLTAADLSENARRFPPRFRRLVPLALVMAGAALSARLLVTSIRLPFADDLFRLHIASARGQAHADYAEAWRPAGEWLRKFALPTERISVPAAGIIPWTCGLPSLDLHGLTDRAVARQPVAVRGVLGHEKSATWAYVVASDVVYHVDDLSFSDRAESGSRDSSQSDRIVVQLSNGLWMSMGTPRRADLLRRALRSRGAIVRAGPDEDALAIARENERHRTEFLAWCASVAAERQERMKHAFFRHAGNIPTRPHELAQDLRGDRSLNVSGSP